jgi:hypothetical protein
VRGTEYAEENTIYIYIVCVFSFSLKYIDLHKKHYFNIQALETTPGVWPNKAAGAASHPCPR